MIKPIHEIDPKIHRAASLVCNRFMPNSGSEKKIAAQALFENPDEVPGVGAFMLPVETPDGNEMIVINDPKVLFIDPNLFDIRGEPVLIINQSGSQ